jgi:hypothetical protein
MSHLSSSCNLAILSSKPRTYPYSNKMNDQLETSPVIGYAIMVHWTLCRCWFIFSSWLIVSSHVLIRRCRPISVTDSMIRFANWMLVHWKLGKWTINSRENEPFRFLTVDTYCQLLLYFYANKTIASFIISLNTSNKTLTKCCRFSVKRRRPRYNATLQFYLAENDTVALLLPNYHPGFVYDI